jgi:CheY-like chemotaxis protein
MSELIRRSLGESVRVETVLAGEIWPAFVDANQVESALLNLSVNARDAMGSGGRLTIETGNTYLDEAYVAQRSDVAAGDYVFIAVSDTGCGMTEDVMQHALEPFYTTKGVGLGTGLGLSQVYGFVKQSGGHLELYSEPGCGTTVKMYLPRHIAQRAVVTTEPAPVAGPLPGGSETILVVEDDDGVRGYSANAVRHLGYEVLEASSAAAALAWIESRPDISLMFTDVGLPGMNGTQLAAQAVQLLQGLKIVYTSGYARTAVAALGLANPEIPLLPKPFRLDGLARTLRSVLDRG